MSKNKFQQVIYQNHFIDSVVIFLSFLEKSPGTKTSAKMKPIAEGMEDDVFEESSPSESQYMPSTSTNEV